MANILIAYFSRSGENYVNGSIEPLTQGNTEAVARMIAEVTGGDLFKIDTVETYPEDYHACTDVAAAEKRVNARPALKELPQEAAGYSTIILGYPNWWGTMPMPVYTFLESIDTAGKTILPYCTHEGSGLSATEYDIARTCPEADVLTGLAIHGAEVIQRPPAVRAAVEAWLTRSLN